jgi:flagellar hook-length control protein FliK
MAPTPLTSDETKVPQTPDKPEAQTDGANLVAPDAAAVIMALNGAQIQPAQPAPSPGSAPLPADPGAAGHSGSEKRVPLLELADRREAAAQVGDEPAGRPNAGPELAALTAQATVAASARQALPEVRAPGGRSEAPADMHGEAQDAATASTPPAAVPVEARIASPTTHAPDVAARLGSPAFADDFSNRIVWMAGNGQQAAEFRIDPPHLGPVEVRLALSNDQANLVLLSPHASVREALQSTLPRLQELLGAAGINLGSVHVGTQGSGQRNQNADRSAVSSERLSVGGIESHHALSPDSGWLVRGTGVVDIYA